jgi:hypothetical protein
LSSIHDPSPTPSRPADQHPPSIAKVGIGFALAIAGLMSLMAFKAPRADVERSMATMSVSATGILPLQDAPFAVN